MALHALPAASFIPRNLAPLGAKRSSITVFGVFLPHTVHQREGGVGLRAHGDGPLEQRLGSGSIPDRSDNLPRIRRRAVEHCDMGVSAQAI